MLRIVEETIPEDGAWPLDIDDFVLNVLRESHPDDKWRPAKFAEAHNLDPAAVRASMDRLVARGLAASFRGVDLGIKYAYIPRPREAR